MILCIDVETSKAPNHFPWIPNSYLSMVGIYTSEGKHYHWVFNHNAVGIKPQVRMVKEIQLILDSADLIICHNTKFEYHWLNHIGIKFNKPTHCTMVTEYLLNGQNNRIEYNLATCCLRHGLDPKIDVVKTYWDSGIDTKDIPIDTLVDYCIQDCKITLQLYNKQVSVIPSRMGRILKLQNAFVECLFELESNGMVVDMPYLKEQTALYTNLKEKLDERLSYFIVDNVPELRDIPHSLTSGDHLSAILYGGIIKYDSTEFVTREYKTKPPRTYERACTKEVSITGLSFKPIKGTETKKEGYYQTNKDVLSMLKGASRAQKEFLTIIEEKARVDKILSTYLIGMEKHIYGDNTIHPSFNQALTVTGRLSSSQPNFQNLPRGSTDEVAKRIFIPRSTERLIINGDLSALEWCVGAQLSGDEVMIQEIIDGVDIHTANSLSIFGSDAFRQESKTISFRSLYGGSAYAFFMDNKMPNKSLKEWEQIHARFYDKYSGLKRWQDDLYLQVCKSGRYEAFTGRWWQFHKEPNYYDVLEYSKPAICNYQVQGVATGDIVPFAMMIIRKRIIDEELDCKMICQVHDSIVTDTHKRHADRVADLIWKTFNELPQRIRSYWKYPWITPMTGEIEIGNNYKDLKKAYGKLGKI